VLKYGKLYRVSHIPTPQTTTSYYLLSLKN